MFKDNIEVKILKEKTFFSVIVVAIFIGGVSIYALNLFLPLEYRHSDSVGYLNSLIRPVLYSGRFFPLGHQEFNFLTLEKFGFLGLFSLPFIQSLISIFCLYKLIPLRSNNLKLLLIIPIFISSLSVSFSNLIIPERNQLFFLLLFLYFTFESTDTRRIKLGLLFASISLYYKEPTLVIYLAFSAAMIILKISKNIISYKDILDLKFWYKKLSFELYLLVMSVLFFISYIIIQSLQTKGELYTQGGDLIQYLEYTFSIQGLYHYPFLLLSLAISIVFIINGLSSGYLQRAFVLFLGANAYAFGIFALKMPSGFYYFSAANLLIFLSCCYVFADMFENSEMLKWKNRSARAIFIVTFVFFTYQTCVISVTQLSSSKAKQVRLGVISSYLNEVEGNKDLNIYYNLKEGNYLDYSSSVMNLYIRTKIDNKFTLYSRSGCYVWHESNEDGYYQCKKANFNLNDDYDFVIDDTNDNKFKVGYKEYKGSIINSDAVTVYYKSLVE
ncbi:MULTISPECIES: hypothetical protein [Vibrio]|nr:MULTISPECIES: hypothetical protein [Vibrio]